MGMSSHPDWEWVEEVKFSGSGDEGISLPPGHTEGLAHAEDPTPENAARDVYGNEDLFGPGLQQEWDRITGPDSSQEAFQGAYAAYVTNPTPLYREDPAQYQFLKEHVFYGLEYRRETDFSEQVNDGIEALGSMEALRPEVWEGLSVNERMEVLQEVENRLAERTGRPPVSVTAEPMELGAYGYCDGTSIHINQDLVTDGRELTQAVDTIAHEGRHAYQYYAIEHPGFHYDDAQVAAWEKNFGEYVNGFLDPEGYRKQPVEADAWAFGEAIRDGLYGGRQA